MIFTAAMAVMVMTPMPMMIVPMPMMMVMAMLMIVLMPVRAIVGLERRGHLDAGKSMRGDQRLNLGPLLQPDAVV